MFIHHHSSQRSNFVSNYPNSCIIIFFFKLVSYFSGILKEVMDKCVPNASAVEVCQFGDHRLLEETGKVFKKEKNLKKGIQYQIRINFKY